MYGPIDNKPNPFLSADVVGQAFPYLNPPPYSQVYAQQNYPQPPVRDRAAEGEQSLTIAGVAALINHLFGNRKNTASLATGALQGAQAGQDSVYADKVANWSRGYKPIADATKNALTLNRDQTKAAIQQDANDIRRQGVGVQQERVQNDKAVNEARMKLWGVQADHYRAMDETAKGQLDLAIKKADEKAAADPMAAARLKSVVSALSNYYSLRKDWSSLARAEAREKKIAELEDYLGVPRSTPSLANVVEPMSPYQSGSLGLRGQTLEDVKARTRIMAQKAGSQVKLDQARGGLIQSQIGLNQARTGQIKASAGGGTWTNEDVRMYVKLLHDADVQDQKATAVFRRINPVTGQPIPPTQADIDAAALARAAADRSRGQAERLKNKYGAPPGKGRTIGDVPVLKLDLPRSLGGNR